MKQTATFKLEKLTKNTAKYQEVVEQGLFPMIGPVYIQKSTFQTSVSDKIPDEIMITITVENDK